MAKIFAAVTLLVIALTIASANDTTAKVASFLQKKFATMLDRLHPVDHIELPRLQVHLTSLSPLLTLFGANIRLTHIRVMQILNHVEIDRPFTAVTKQSETLTRIKTRQIATDIPVDAEIFFNVVGMMMPRNLTGTIKRLTMNVDYFFNKQTDELKIVGVTAPADWMSIELKVDGPQRTGLVSIRSVLDNVETQLRHALARPIADLFRNVNREDLNGWRQDLVKLLKENPV